MDTAFSSQTHMELKRDFAEHLKRENGTSTGGDVTLVDGPLFERYAFLSPGKFSFSPFPGGVTSMAEKRKLICDA